MRRFPQKTLAVSIAVLFGALSFWATHGDKAREFRHLRENALCVLELREGAPSTLATFTTLQTIDQLHVGVRPRGNRQPFSLSISGSEGLVCSVTTDSTRFSCGCDIPPGTYQVTLRQEPGSNGVLVVVSDKKPAYVTGWQIWSRVYLGLLALSAIWASVARRSTSSRHRATSLYLFQILLLGFVVIFLYLLVHEGGHALGEVVFGRYDFARSDFWGIHGAPHSGGTSGPPLEAWQQAVISGGGPIFPAFAGWALFLLWRSRFGRSLRNARPIVNLYFSAIVGMLVFPFIVAAGLLLGIIRGDGDWNGFITNVPGPLWLIKGLVWGILLVNAVILWRVVPEVYRSWKAQFRKLRESVT